MSCKSTIAPTAVNDRSEKTAAIRLFTDQFPFSSAAVTPRSIG